MYNKDTLSKCLEFCNAFLMQIRRIVFGVFFLVCLGVMYTQNYPCLNIPTFERIWCILSVRKFECALISVNI